MPDTDAIFGDPGTGTPGQGGTSLAAKVQEAKDLEQKRIREQWASDRGQYRNTLNDAGFAQQYRQSLDQLSQARLAEGMGMAQRGMAAQAVGRGSNPMAQRAAIMQGGANALAATNQSAQFAQQADMAGAQMAQAEWARRLQSMEHQEQMRQQALATQAGRYATNVQANQANAGGGFGDILGGLGGMAAGMAMFSSDVQNKTGLVPLGGGAYDAGASVGATYQPPAQAQPSIQDQLYQAQMEGIQRRQEMEQQRLQQQQTQNVAGGIGQIFTGAGQMFGSDENSKSLLMALSAENERMRQALGAAPPRTPASNPLDQSMDNLKPYAFSYKPGFAEAQGQDQSPRAGIMAQDAERDPLTAAMVRETPAGKAIDMPTAMSTSLAMTSRLNERERETAARVQQLEAALGIEQGHMDRSLAGTGPTTSQRLAPQPTSLRELAANPDILEMPPDVVPAYSDVVYSPRTNARGTPIGPSVRLRTADTTPDQIARQQARDARATRWNDPSEGY